MTKHDYDSSATSRRRLPKRMQWIVVLALMLIVSAILLIGWASSTVFGGLGNAHAAAQVASDHASDIFRPTSEQLANLEIVPVQKKNFRVELVTDGKIAANAERTTSVFSPYSGRVTKIIANLGDHVNQGSPLLTLEASEFVQAQNDLVGASAALKTARSQLSQAQINEKRKHGLYDLKAGSLQDWQQSQAEMETAQNAVRSAEIALAAVRNRLRILGQSSSMIDNLEHTANINPLASIVAPINGIVIDRQVGLGQYVQSNAANSLYTIADLSTVWLIANVREEDASLIKRGSLVEVQVSAFPQKLFNAKVTYVAPSIDPNTRRLAVRAEIPNPDGVLKPEMFATFSVVSANNATSIGIPERAVLYEGDAARVWVANQDGSLAVRRIHTGRNINGMVEVLSGLNEGDKVVAGGSLFIDHAAQAD